jgi:hypothetical protein
VCDTPGDHKRDDGKVGICYGALNALPALPLMGRWRLRAHILLGDDMPSLCSNVAVQLGLTDRRLGVAVELNGKVEYTTAVLVTNGIATWNAEVEMEVYLPATSTSTLPDTFVYLFHGVGGRSETRLCFARLPTAKLISDGLNRAVATWHALTEDLTTNALTEGEAPGAVLMRIGIGTPDSAAKTPWGTDAREFELKTPYQLRCHVYQGAGGGDEASRHHQRRRHCRTHASRPCGVGQRRPA